MTGKPQPGARRPLCDGCRRQRLCLEVGGRRLCRECREAEVRDRYAVAVHPLDKRLVRTLFDRARDGATER